MAQLSAVSMIIGAAIVLFWPGFVVSFVIFRPKTIDTVERFTFSLVLSIAIVPLLTFVLNVLGIRITEPVILLEVAAITLVAGVAVGVQHVNRSAKP